MKKFIYLFLCCLICISCFSISACSNESKITYSGSIIFNSNVMEGVVIKTDDRALCISNNNGEFEFTSVSKSVKVYPEKDGYFFEPSFVIVTEESPKCKFEAKKIKELNGTLKLNKVITKPTYIVSYSDNYLYRNKDKDCLKVFDMSLNYKGKIINIFTEDGFLYKNEKNEVIIEDDIEIVCGTQSQIGFLINTYFKYNYNESHTTYTEYSYLYIAGEQTNNKLKNNQIHYSLEGINNKSNKFTFDITFVFDYFESENEFV